MTQLNVFGVGGQARVISDIAQLMGIKVAAFIKFQSKSEEELFNPIHLSHGLAPIVDESSFEPHQDSLFFIAVGDNLLRLSLANRLTSKYPKEKFPNIIHPSAVVSSTSTLGFGNFIGANSFVGPFARVGDFCILNTHSSLDHDSHLESFAFLAPNVTIGGGSRIGKRSFIGMSSSVSSNVEIGFDCTVGAMSFVRSNLPPRAKVFGIPI